MARIAGKRALVTCLPLSYWYTFLKPVPRVQHVHALTKIWLRGAVGCGFYEGQHAWTEFFPFWQRVKRSSAAVGDFLNFESCLIVPVQRIPRYQLLIGDYLKSTPEGHPDCHDLKLALEKVAAVGQYVNNMQRFYEDIQKVDLNQRFGRQLTALLSAFIGFYTGWRGAPNAASGKCEEKSGLAGGD